MRDFPGEYPPDWDQIRAAAYEATGHRCIRCGHPYRKGTHGTGEWSPCDDQCSHGPRMSPGPVRDMQVPEPDPGAPIAQWRILTCHHFDGNKANSAWWNLMALCQRCHLQIQGKVNPDTPYFLEHSEWIRPYVAGFYAAKYLKLQLTREQVMERLTELLKLEQLV